jgi:hypothetical protein
MTVKPITPAEIGAQRERSLPPEVIEAFNEEIAITFHGKSATVLEKGVVERILTKLPLSSRSELYAQHWLDVESYDPTFTFIWKE